MIINITNIITLQSNNWPDDEFRCVQYNRLSNNWRINVYSRGWGKKNINITNIITLQSNNWPDDEFRCVQYNRLSNNWRINVYSRGWGKKNNNNKNKKRNKPQNRYNCHKLFSFVRGQTLLSAAFDSPIPKTEWLCLFKRNTTFSHCNTNNSQKLCD